MYAKRKKTYKADCSASCASCAPAASVRPHQEECCYRTKVLLKHRRNLKDNFLDLENAIRHSPKASGIRLNKVGGGAFEQAMRAAVADDALSGELMDAMLSARAVL